MAVDVNGMGVDKYLWWASNQGDAATGGLHPKEYRKVHSQCHIPWSSSSGYSSTCGSTDSSDSVAPSLYTAQIS